MSNVLVVSDLHLGSALRGETDDTAFSGHIAFSDLRRVVRHDTAVSRFIDYHTQNRETDDRGKEQPWTLVFNGDTFDFLHIDVRATPEAGLKPTDEEQLYGLEFDEDRSLWKLEMIAATYRRTTEALAQFVEGGNKAVFIAGNHDVDLWFSKVRERLVEHVAGFSATPDIIEQGILFEPWFYLAEKQVYIEHGHRFDPYATFPDPLMPMDVEKKRRLAPNFGHFSLRYFCNRVRSFPIHDMDQNPVAKVFQWMRTRKIGEIWSAFLQFSFFVFRYFAATLRDRIRKDEAGNLVVNRRRKRLRAFARHYNLPMRRILALDALKRSHVGANLGRLFQGLQLDRIFIGVAYGFLILTGLFLTEGWLLAFLIMSSTAGSYSLLKWLDKTRPVVDVQSILGRIAKKIVRLTGAPVVVFGHTHQPTLKKIGRARWLNPGSWEHLPWCRGHRQNAPCNCSTQFAFIRAASTQPVVELRKWCSCGQTPRVMDAASSGPETPHSLRSDLPTRA